MIQPRLNTIKSAEDMVVPICTGNLALPFQLSIRGPGTVRTDRFRLGCFRRMGSRVLRLRSPQLSIDIWLVASAALASAQDNLAQQAQNPVADLAVFPLQSNWDFGVGPEDRTRYVGLFQPVVPWELGEDWTLISRLIMPFINTPIDADSNVHGLGDSLLQFYFSPKSTGKFIWGVGPNVLMPTRSSPELGFGDWGVGVDAVGLISDGPIVAGA